VLYSNHLMYSAENPLSSYCHTKTRCHPTATPKPAVILLPYQNPLSSYCHTKTRCHPAVTSKPVVILLPHQNPLSSYCHIKTRCHPAVTSKPAVILLPHQLSPHSTDRPSRSTEKGEIPNYLCAWTWNLEFT
jgi:hypothetical protein